MATPAVNRSRETLAGLLHLLAPYPGRAAFAVRLALICALTMLVVEIYQTPEPALTVYVAFFVIKPDRVTSVILSAAMLILISLIVGTVMLVTMRVIDQPLWRVAAMTILSFCLLFAASASKLRPVAGIIALIAAYALDLLGTIQIGELATRGLLYAWLFIGVPAGASMAVNLLLGPSPRRLAEGALAHRLTLAAAVLRTQDSAIRRDFSDAVSEGTGEIQSWLKLTAVEKTASTEDIAALRQATASITPILFLVELVDRDPDRLLPGPIRERLAQTFEEMASILNSGGYPIDIAVEDAAGGLPLSSDAAMIFAEMREALTRFTEAPAPDVPGSQSKKAKGRFFLPDAFTNSEHVQYALKTTAAAMICYVTYSLLDWPGIHTCLITCYIVSLGTTAETVEKLTLRILGALVGAATGITAIVLLMPDVTSIGTLMAVVFVAAFLSAWIAAGGPRISYAGLQLAFVFFLCVIQGAGPSFDMTIARDRVIGILFGDLVVYVLFATVWPVSVARRIDPALASLLRHLSGMMGAAERSKRWSLASQAQTALGAIEQDLVLAAYEPAAIQPEPDWLGVRRQVTREIATLKGPLLLSASQSRFLGSDIRHRLDRLADSLADPRDAVSPRASDSIVGTEPRPQDRLAGNSSVMDALVEAHLKSLEQALSRRAEERGMGSHAPA
jgi:multidrug resistance protein MdtO